MFYPTTTTPPGTAASSSGRAPVMDWLSPVLGFGASLLGFGGAREANRANERIARENREFQREMSNTAYQRAAKDLEAAGLNRILALGKPATTPGGAVATMQNEMGQAINSGVAAATAAGQLRNLRATTKNINMDTSKKKTEANYIQSQDALAQMQTQNLLLQQAGIHSANDLKKFEAEIRQAQIPGVKTQEAFFAWLNSTDAEEAYVALGKIGPVALQIARVYFALNKGRIN